MTNDTPIHGIAEFVDAATFYTLDQLCVFCNADPDWLDELIEHGVIEPVGQFSADWKFTSLSVTRIAKAKRLQRDLDLSPAGIAIVFDLLEEIDDLRAQLGKGPRPTE